MITASQIITELENCGNAEKAAHLSGFFKTGKGQYGEGDRFLGVTVPEQRAVAKKYAAAELPVLEQLLASPFHEQRLTALLILVRKYQKKQNSSGKGTIYPFLSEPHPFHQQLGPGRPLLLCPSGSLAARQRAVIALRTGREYQPLGTANCHCQLHAFRTARGFQRLSCHCRQTAAPPPRPHPQGYRMVTSGNREKRQRHPGGIPARPLSPDAPHHVKICH